MRLRLKVVSLTTVIGVNVSERGVAMDTTVVETVSVEVQELALTELAQVGGGFGEAVLA